MEHDFQEQKIEKLDAGIWLIAFTAVLNFIAGYFCITLGKKNNSLALSASGKHLQVDTYSTLAIVAGLFLMLVTKLYWLDKVIALITGVLIIYNGYKILRSSLAGIMDEADIELLNEMVQVLNNNRNENWVDLHNLRVIKYGSLLHIDCHLTVPWFLNVHEAHKEIEAFSALAKNEFGESVELFVHADGCMDFSCRICSKKDCIERKFPYKKTITWDVHNISSDQKHMI